MAFSADSFVQSPSVEILEPLKKSELLEICKHYGLDTRSTLRKSEVKQSLLEHLVDENILPETALPSPISTPTSSVIDQNALEIKRLELEFKTKEMENQNQKEREEREMKQKEKEMEMEMEMKVKQMEIDREIKLKEVEARAASPTSPNSRFEVTKYLKMVPPFQDRDVDKYFMHFEKLAESLSWPVDNWVLLLQSALKGRAQEVYATLSVEQSKDYKFVKNAILKAYELVPEAYRQKFRNYLKQENQTYVEFAREKETLFDRWCASKEVEDDYSNLKQLMVIEEFKRRVPNEVKTHLDEHKIKSLSEAAILADDYALTHKTSFNTYNRKPKFGSFNPKNSGAKTTNYTQNKSDNDSKGSNVNNPQQHRPPVICDHCKKPGHTKSSCWVLLGRDSFFGNRGQTKTVAHVSTKSKEVMVSEEPKSKLAVDVIEEELKPFISKGFVSLVNDKDTRRPITILRDTAASRSVILENILPFSAGSSVGCSMSVTGIECNPIEVPLHEIYLESGFVTGKVKVGIRPTLPAQGIVLLLGNDLGGKQVFPEIKLVKRPIDKDEAQHLKDEIPGLFPACAVTRAMSKRQNKVQSDSNIDLGDTFMGHLDELDDMVGQNANKVVTQEKPEEIQDQKVLNRQHLITEQGKDPELVELAEKALDQDEAEKVPSCLYFQSGILMRKWRPPDVTADDDMYVVNQIVVPKLYRNEILQMAHETPLAGHLGVNKTLTKF